MAIEDVVVLIMVSIMDQGVLIVDQVALLEDDQVPVWCFLCLCLCSHLHFR